MKLSDEMLMRFADGELAPDEQAAVEAALAADAEGAARVAALRAQREKLARAFGNVLEEPVPERLLKAARTAPAAAGVTGIEEARARKKERTRSRWSLPQWSAIAASLILGLFIGNLVLQPDDAAVLASRDGGLIAQGDLARALTDRLSGDAATDSAVEVSLTYRARSGEYCRAFSFSREAAVAGVACREDDGWRIEALARSERAADSNYRQAGSALPPFIAQAVEAQIDGEPLDASAEASARSRGWRN